MRNEEPKESRDPAFIIPETTLDEEKMREGWLLLLLLNKFRFLSELRALLLASRRARAAGVSDDVLSNGFAAKDLDLDRALAMDDSSSFSNLVL